MTRIWNALKSEDGAVTVDWIVLTGAAAFMAVATLTGLSGGLGNTAKTITASLDTVEIGEAQGGGAPAAAKEPEGEPEAIRPRGTVRTRALVSSF